MSQPFETNVVAESVSAHPVTLLPSDQQAWRISHHRSLKQELTLCSVALTLDRGEEFVT